MPPFHFSNQLQILFKALLKQGDELRVVGGAVRDFLANKKTADIDLACKYKAEEVIAILKKNNIKVIPTGIKHGTVTAIIDGETFEITTLRQDVETYGRSAKVEFTDDFYLDAKRRDFTINAMSIDYSGRIYDYFNGQKDLENKIVKFIGNAEDRINEDYLRILRFFRFSCYYCDSFDQEAIAAATKHKNHIGDLSADRVRNEMVKIISCNDNHRVGKVLCAMQDVGILDLALKVKVDLLYLDRLSILDSRLKEESGHLMKFSALIYGNSYESDKIAKGLNFSNQDTKYISSIINPKFSPDLNMSKTDLMKILFEYDKNTVIDSIKIGMVREEFSDLMIKNFLNIKERIILSEIPKFHVNGNDLLEIGATPKKIGKLLLVARNYWIENDFSLSKKDVIEHIKQIQQLN